MVQEAPTNGESQRRFVAQSPNQYENERIDGSVENPTESALPKTFVRGDSIRRFGLPLKGHDLWAVILLAVSYISLSL